MTDNRLKRLTYRSWHRGCKETDLILGRFADARLKTLEPVFVDTYEQLLDEDDADIWGWLVGKTAAPEKYAVLLELLKNESAECTVRSAE
jgi:antitoxin CptB